MVGMGEWCCVVVIVYGTVGECVWYGEGYALGWGNLYGRVGEGVWYGEEGVLWLGKVCGTVGEGYEQW